MQSETLRDHEAGRKPRNGALSGLRSSFSTSGRELLQRILPFWATGKSPHARQGIGPLRDLARSLLSVRGEASGVAIATDLLALYEQSASAVRDEFFDFLASDLNPDSEVLAACWERYQDEGAAALPALAAAVEAPRQELFRRLNLATGGTAALVRMRADLLAAKEANSAVDIVDADLNHLLQSWFNRGFLSMRSIDWSSPANLLERIIRYEAVHDITSWTELRSRLDPEDRRCFAFFHPVMPDEPLIFVEVALTADMPDNIQAMLDPDRMPISASDATTATFYSISNCQPGLRGISFGHFLIKQVVHDLKRELPNLTCFVTLSPIPGLVRWMRSIGVEEAALEAIASREVLDGAAEERLRTFVLDQAKRYFLDARNGSGKPLDPVARFHLGNGARLERLNWRADTSLKGRGQSGGLMVNYLYDLATIEENHEAFVESGEVITGQPFRKALKHAGGLQDK